MKNSDQLFDSKHIWHPYSSMINSNIRFTVVSAKGILLKLNTGKTIIDGMSSWWAAIHGYNHTKLNSVLKHQIQKMSHVMFGGITHPPAISLCRKLIQITPRSLECVFLADSGSVAIEIAMKMALQYWKSLGKLKKFFLTIKGGYHGDTFYAMSICDPHHSMHSMYHKSLLPKHLFAEIPKCSFSDKWNKNDIKSFSNLLNKNKSTIAAIILEPIVQGVGGMNFYHPNYLKQVKKFSVKYDIPLILDEIATGFGRTGKLFAFEHANIVPDILCLGKALTGGMLSLSAVLTNRKIAKTISIGKPGYFMHGPTFMGNPLACVVSHASINLLLNTNWQQKIKHIEQQLIYHLIPLRTHFRVRDVRVIGAIGVVECFNKINIIAMQKFFVEQGVWIRPYNKIIYIVPPYIIDEDSINKLTNAIKLSLNNTNLFFSKNI
ncbi:adenosylmethionine-8-amino-7-oxononanoateaminotransferase [Buchnera aphidicola (Nipponaphis monzeni)]|uniref:Adenosylmethionine-8-amino-7-oxononanoate aminotransferase n=1 Tax=Buchnera aphidicola (Nipponaphis monzeni) TaxID=2495405 RepID=A0A455TAC2_9GAMM|nr:adenosylmethionine--8-amino-7-oxononanoate transaminase [Buchnera aphidicola]BBI01240.1 adenosylmethionine-8-amino-7-oxononanoateaminotransferase [Buchnera aphidicola (Nipponaphis monzeni)]